MTFSIEGRWSIILCPTLEPMMHSRKCKHCDEEFSLDLNSCPHCACPSLYPNVDRVGVADQRAALAQRYNAARSRSVAAGTLDKVEKLEQLALKSEACKTLPAGELVALASSDTRVGATYYQQVSGGCRIPDTNEWDKLRRIADAAVHRSYGHNIHFAALSTAGRWLSNYGDGAVFFKEKMISHRATVFEENTAVWASERTADISVPPGVQAVWEERHKLVVAKLVDKVSGSGDLNELILSSGTTTGSDLFLEVHIYGTFTLKSMSSIIFKKGALPDLKRESILERAVTNGIVVKEIA